MPYAREDKATQRGHLRKRFGRRRNSFRFKKPNVRRNRNQIASMSSKVMRLQRQIATRYSYCQFRYMGSLVPVTFVTPLQLTNPAVYAGVFGADEAFGNKRAFYSKALYIDMLFRSGNEPSPIDYTVFVVSAKRGACNQLIHDAGENLTNMNGVGLNENHYTYQSGKAFMNPQLFNIHYVKRLCVSKEVGSGGELSTATSDARKRLYLKIPWSKRIIKGLAPQSFQNITFADTEDDCKLWILVFNNNSQIDAQSNAVDMNILWNCKA